MHKLHVFLTVWVCFVCANAEYIFAAFKKKKKEKQPVETPHQATFYAHICLEQDLMTSVSDCMFPIWDTIIKCKKV